MFVGLDYSAEVRQEWRHEWRHDPAANEVQRVDELQEDCPLLRTEARPVSGVGRVVESSVEAAATLPVVVSVSGLWGPVNIVGFCLIAQRGLLNESVCNSRELD